ncbi:MAG TPA: hypothetical protein VI136_18005 [Verrucomicrobiae bacterium]
MPLTKTEALRPQMIVASDVKNIDGMLLIPAGAALTERQIDILQAWGVTQIDVQAAAGAEEENGDPLSKLPPEVLAKWTEEAKALFWKWDDSNLVEAEILNLMLRRRVQRAGTK